MISKKGCSSIEFKGIKFDFDYNWYSGRPATYEEPEEHEEWEIFNITINDVDAEDLIDNMREQFEEEAINHLSDY
jgi:hypothetical protein